MSIIDILLVGLLFISIVRGYSRGFIIQFFSLISTISSIIIAYMFYPIISDLIKPFFKIKELNEIFSLPIPIAIPVNEIAANAVAFVVLFFIAKIALMLIGRTLNILSKLPLINLINRIAGSALSSIEMFIITLILVNIASLMPFELVQNIIEQSYICQYILIECGLTREKIIEMMIQKI